MTTLQLSQIRTDGGTQTRAAISNDVVTEYAEAMRAGDTFPPVVVVFDGESYWLADGFHRVEAARQAGFNQIAAEVHQGTRRDAVLASVGANARHGLRRTNQDKRRAVQTLVKDEEWVQWSDREIARRAGVSAPFVARIRGELAGGATVNVYSQPERRGADGRVINTAPIGKPAVNTRLTLPDIRTIAVGDTIMTISGTMGTVRRVFDDHVLADFDKDGELVEEEWSLNHLRGVLKAEDPPAIVDPVPAPVPTAPTPSRDFLVGDMVIDKWGARWGDTEEQVTPWHALDHVDEQPNGAMPAPAVPLDHPAHQSAQPAAPTPSHDFQIGDWVRTKWDGYAIVRTVDEKGISVEDSGRLTRQYTVDKAVRELTPRTKREFRIGDRVHTLYKSGKKLCEVIGREWLNTSVRPLEGHAIVRWPSGGETTVPFWQLELDDQPADEGPADDPLDRDLYNLDLTPAGFKAGEALRLEDGQVGVIVPVDDAAGLLKKDALLTVETPQPAPAVEPFDLPESIIHMPPLPWKLNGDTYIVSAENPMLTAARVYDSKVGQLIVEAMNERYAAFARQDNDDLKVGEQVYYLSGSAGNTWRLVTVTGLSAKRVQIKLPDKAKPSYVELRSLDRRPFGWPLLPGPVPRKRRWKS